MLHVIKKAKAATAAGQNVACCCLKAGEFPSFVLSQTGEQGVGAQQTQFAQYSSSGIKAADAGTFKGPQIGNSSLIVRFNHEILNFNRINSSHNLLQKRGFASPGKQYSERRLIGYSPQQLFDVVSSIENYNKFVPWCQKSVITKQLEQQKNNKLYNQYMEAELEVGFQLFIERYTSRVSMQAPTKIRTTVADSSLFNKLDSNWEFQPGPTPNTCWVQFSVDFTFKTALYQNVATVFMEEVVQRMVASFENRCAQLYGPPSISSRLKLNGQVKKS